MHLIYSKTKLTKQNTKLFMKCILIDRLQLNIVDTSDFTHFQFVKLVNKQTSLQHTHKHQINENDAN